METEDGTACSGSLTLILRWLYFLGPESVDSIGWLAPDQHSIHCILAILSFLSQQEEFSIESVPPPRVCPMVVIKKTAHDYETHVTVGRTLAKARVAETLARPSTNKSRYASYIVSVLLRRHLIHCVACARLRCCSLECWLARWAMDLYLGIQSTYLASPSSPVWERPMGGTKSPEKFAMVTRAVNRLQMVGGSIRGSRRRLSRRINQHVCRLPHHPHKAWWHGVMSGAERERAVDVANGYFLPLACHWPATDGYDSTIHYWPVSRLYVRGLLRPEDTCRSYPENDLGEIEMQKMHLLINAAISGDAFLSASAVACLTPRASTGVCSGSFNTLS